MTSSTQRLIPIELIRRDAQVRTSMDAEALDSLTESVRQRGVVVPVIVRQEGDWWVVVDGHRRVEAATRAALTVVPAVVLDGDATPDRITELQIITATQREGLTPMDKARGIAHLMQTTGWTAAKVAARLQFSEATASKLLALLRLSPAIQSRVDAGEIGLGAAYRIAQTQDPAEQERLAHEVMSGRRTHARATRTVKSRRRSTSPATDATADAPSPSRLTARLGGGRIISVRGPGLTFDLLLAWLEELLTKARAAREQGTELHAFARLLADQART